ncbi:MAG TPA: carbon starvation CstA family protein [Candidatus Binatia bacterium]|nr:carbon starvation CstA family protein [Candidatus Binatia bacterium]
MSLSLLALVTIGALILGYTFYGRFIADQYRLDDLATTPAVARNDGIDFVPTRPFYLLGQHFSAIAAAGPIAGPILACMQFGWLPCILWISFGVVFIGAVHDLSSLIASVRHGGRSVAEIVRESLGPRAWLAIMLFIWIALIYVIVAFTDITASTFVSGGDDLAGGELPFNPGGAVAAASVLYLLLAVVMGVVERWLKPPLWLLTVVFVPATLGMVWLGTQISTWLVLDGKSWSLAILAYCFVASLTPVWALLQPRGYLGGFVLYLALFAGVVGVFFGGFEIKQEAFKTWHAAGPTGALFPFLFVTIACGACSGFHGLVCSGTTSKQIARESHCHPIGYGAMLLEGFVALIALATVMMADSEALAGKAPGAIYGAGLGRFLTVMIGDEHLLFATTFGSMAFSTFVFDTLDVSTRLGRYTLQELFGWTGSAGAIAATALTLVLPVAFVMAADEGAYRTFWTLFGTSNQLLAALTFLAVSVWLRRTGRAYWFTLAPLVFVMSITLYSHAIPAATAVASLRAPDAAMGAATLNGGVALVLIALAAFLVFEGARALLEPGSVRTGNETWRKS